jgi:hypothetical protein
MHIVSQKGSTQMNPTLSTEPKGIKNGINSENTNKRTAIQNVLLTFDTVFSKDQNEVPAVSFVYFLKSYVSTLCADQVQQVIQNNKSDSSVSNSALVDTETAGSQLDVIMGILKSGMRRRLTTHVRGKEKEASSSESALTRLWHIAS